MAFDYKKLSISIIADSKKAISSINSMAKSLSDLAKIDLSNITSQISNLAESLKIISTDGTKNISRSINSVKNALKNFSNLDFNEIAKGFQRANLAVDPFLKKLKFYEPELKNFANALDLSKVVAQFDVLIAKAKLLNQQINNKAAQQDLINAKVETEKLKQQKIQQQIDKQNKSLQNKAVLLNNNVSIIRKIISGTARVGYTYYMVSRIANIVGTIITNASNYNEILNKFQVAMRGSWKDVNGDVQSTYDNAIKFVNELSYATGISKKLLMDYQATFKNMLGAIEGVNEKIQYQLSEALTRMAIDYASLFNVTIETAMSQFQSVLAGRKVSIRTTSGIDVTDAALYEYYKEIYAGLGEEAPKTIRQLSQLEKRLLSIYAIQKQMSNMGVEGDYARTVKNSSFSWKQLLKKFVNACKSGVIALCYC